MSDSHRPPPRGRSARSGISNVLVANRGEVALRIALSARALGYRTTAIYSDADAGSPHIAAADVAVRIGGTSVTESYLDREKVLQAARKSGADAVHPGYGLLSENAEFARACLDAGLAFVGPSPNSIALMGDKTRARHEAERAGVPCVPGYAGEDPSETAFIQAAARIGYPLMIKAAGGGGGRGMRRVHTERELRDALPRARGEAQAAFGDGRLLLERAIDGARHVEVQVLGDTHGNAIHLGERDCSVQRRFQKVIEECPSPAVDAELRERLGAAALSLVRAAGYVGAGTVEFLLDSSGRFYFLEMNTRLQVEHAVTELVTGIDIVAEQLRIADGLPLSVDQAGVRLDGHAIEARLYAEDPAAGFLPQAGLIRRWRAPRGPGVRVDHALCDGLQIGTHYDPLLAKVVAHGSDREQARRRLERALGDTVLLGPRHNRDFLRRVIDHPLFARHAHDTGFLEQAGADTARQPAPAPLDLAVGALAIVLREASSRDFGEQLGFANGRPVAFPVTLDAGDSAHTLCLCCIPGGFEIAVDGATQVLSVASYDPDEGRMAVEQLGLRKSYAFAFDGERVLLDGGSSLSLTDVTRAPPRSEGERGSGRLLSPMDATVVEVNVVPGERVAPGATLLVLEAMKLQHAVVADAGGSVTEVAVAKGQQVTIGQLLVQLAVGEDGP